MSRPRFAIYFTPPPDSALDAVGRFWLDGERGVLPGAAGTLDELPDREGLVATPRRYGFHATLKAPFPLAAQTSETALAQALADFAAGRTQATVNRLAVRRLGNFLALMPVEPSLEIARLHEACHHAFEPFRRPLNPAELDRRAAGLSAREQAYLAEHGYPWALDRFRFHMTLTGPVELARADAVQALLERICLPVTQRPLVIDAASLMVEPSPGADFRLIARFPLKRAAAAGS